jgi:hypothetical protein
MYPTLRVRQTPLHPTSNDQTRPIPAGFTYSQVTQGLHNRPQLNTETTPTVNMEQPSNDLWELKKMMETLISQMNTLLNLISALVSKTK